MPPYKILQLITRADWGGAQRHVFDLATRINSGQFRVTVACAPDGILVHRLRSLGVEVLPVRSFQREIAPIQDVAAVREVAELIRLTGAHLVHAHSSKAGLLGRIAARWCDVPVVYTAHGFAFGGRASPLVSRVGYLGAEWLAGHLWTDRILTVSEADYRLAVAYRLAPAHRVHVIHNGIDPEPFARIPLRDSREDLPVVGTISRLVPGKGLEELLRAAQTVLRHRPVRVMIAGDGPLEAPMKLLAEELGIAQHVRFVGFVEHPASFLREVDLFALPSYKEGLPYTVLEALAAGRPVVASDVGGLPEIITEGVNGRLVPAGNVTLLAQAIRQLLDLPDLKDPSLQARRSVNERFHIDTMISRIQAVYLTLVSGESGG